MATPLFPNGIQGLSDSLWSGTAGSVSKIVGIDYRSIPGAFKAHQKLGKSSPTSGANEVGELCKNSIACSDGSTLWFSSVSGKIWREVNGAWTLVHTTDYTDVKEPKLFVTPALGSIEILAINDTHSANSAKATAQSVQFDEGFDLRVIGLNLRTLGSPTGTITVSVQADNAGEPSGTPLVSDTLDMAELTTENQVFDFEVNQTLAAATTYWIVMTVSALPSVANSVVIRYATTDVYADGKGRRQRIDNDNWEDYAEDQELQLFRYLTSEEAGTAGTVGAEEYDGHIYWANTKLLNKKSIEDLTDWSDEEIRFGRFANGSDHHPMVIQNLSLHIGDKTSIALVDDLGLFIAESAFKLVEPEEITAMTDFDIDILVGTKTRNKGRVLRWDGISDSWSAQDDIDEDGINAFIRDDNFVYVQAGSYGRIYFYNGEKMEPFKRIPGDWSPTKKAKINPNAVGFHLGVPVFGLSSITGNPALQGVYGFGSYGIPYPKTLSLDYPVPTNQFSDIEIGAILTVGADMWVSYATSTDVGVAKLDWSTKYNGAYFETPTLIPPGSRSDYSVVNGFNADYVELPANTDIAIGVKKKYEASFTTLNKENYPDLMQVKSRSTVTKIANLIIKLTLTTHENTSPLIENVSVE